MSGMMKLFAAVVLSITFCVCALHGHAARCRVGGRDCVEYTLSTNKISQCYMYSPSIIIEYRSVPLNDSGSEKWTRLTHHRGITSAPSTRSMVSSRSANAINTADLIYTSFQRYFPPNFRLGDDANNIILRFLQLNHRGGICDCWDLDRNVLLINSSGHIQNNINHLQLNATNLSESSSINVCGGSASVERGVAAEFSAEDERFMFSTERAAVEIDAGDDQYKVRIQVNEECRETPYVEVNFTCEFVAVDTFDEGLEVSFLNWNRRNEWVPIHYFAAHDPSVRTEQNISLGEVSQKMLVLRGYPVNFTTIDNQTVAEATIKLCGPNVFSPSTEDQLYNWEFRWLQTAARDDDNDTDGDSIYISNITITVVNFNNTQRIVIFEDKFEDNSPYQWPPWTDSRNAIIDTEQQLVKLKANLETSSREITTNCLSGPRRLEFTLITAPFQTDCNSTMPFQLQYQRNLNGQWLTLAQQLICVSDSNTTAESDTIISTCEGELDYWWLRSCYSSNQFRFIQLEHRGGYCDCWEVANLAVTLTNGQTRELRKVCGGNDSLEDIFPSTSPLSTSINSVAGFCRDSASVPRVTVSRLEDVQVSGGDANSRCDVSRDAAAMPGFNCPDSARRIEVSFDLVLQSSCDGVDDFSEGVEFSYRRASEEPWIPLKFYTTTTNLTEPLIELHEEESLGDSFVMLRGYQVPYVIQSDNNSKYNLTICNNNIFNGEFQFRWLHTSYQRDNSAVRDVVILDNVTVTARNCNSTYSSDLLVDSFDNLDLNKSKWNDSLSYNVYIHKDMESASELNSCKVNDGGAAYFYLNVTANDGTDTLVGGTNYTIASRQLVTNKLMIPWSFHSCSQSSISPPPTTSSSMTDNNSVPLEVINANLQSLYTSIGTRPNLTSVIYTISSILNELGNRIVELSISEALVSNVSSLVDIAQLNFINNNVSTLDHLAGSTLLRVLDRFALNNHNASASSNVTGDNTILRVENLVLSINTNETTTLYFQFEDSSELGSTRISIPREALYGLDEAQEVRVASIFFRNMSGFLPENMQLDEKNDESRDLDQRVSRLASPVISASLCDNCNIENLENPVEVIFDHSPYIQALVENDMSSSVRCVFWSFNTDDDELLIRGNWSDSGCETTFNSTSTICKCNHLTHFAILLSARPLQLPPQQTLALQVIGYIGVGVSLVAMAAVVVVFVFPPHDHIPSRRPLRTMRNYIHIQLCISLGIAQVIFVAGIEPRLGEGGGVPVGCRLVAVLLHYWFLVSFMWMLMEGVVLYVSLVRVFVTYHGRYIAAFTIASYGLPLLYVGLLTVPLGFIRSSGFRQNQTYDYGYKEACYLNPESGFIWSIIAPVILIFIANIGFFIMVIVIMNRHPKRQHTENKAHKVKHWLKASISLTVVMGITWIVGVVVIDSKIDALLPLAYIFTIFVAFQGLFIFIVVVLLSKQVRENYIKWWKAKVAESDFLSRHFGEKSLTRKTNLSNEKKNGLKFSLPRDIKSSSRAVTKETDDKILSSVVQTKTKIHF